MLVKTRAVRLLPLLGCLVFLVACEAVTTEETVVEKEPVGEVSVGIRPIESEVLLEESLEILFYLNNSTDASIEILPWGTPLEKSLTADRFLVSLNDEIIPYSGRVVKRPAPRPEDYMTLAAGEKKETVVSLSKGYDVSATGEYQIQLKEMVFQNQKSEFLTPVVVESTVVIVRQ